MDVDGTWIPNMTQLFIFIFFKAEVTAAVRTASHQGIPLKPKESNKKGLGQYPQENKSITRKT